MKRSTKKVLDQLDHDLRLLFKELQVYTDDQLNRSPAPDKWSVIQVMHHLMLSEQLSHRYVVKKLSFEPELKKAGIQAKGREWLVRSYLASPLKRKAPPMIARENLPAFASFWDTVKKWKTQRLELRDYLEDLDGNMMDKEIYKHPFAGRLSLPGMLRFFNAHFRRHRRQIEKITRNLTPQREI